MNKRIKWKGLTGLILLVLMLVSSCASSSGVSQKDYDAMKQQLADLQTQLAAAQASGQQTADLQKKIDDLQKNIVLYVVPNAPPKPSATPLPPGQTTTAAPPPTPPAASFVPLAFYVDTVTSGFAESKYNVDPSVGCVRSSFFKRGQHVVWRMIITDTSTGKILQSTDVKTAVLQIPGQSDITMRFGRHGSNDTSPWFWTGAWDVPTDYPLGYITYSITVTTADGKVGTYKELQLDAEKVDASGRVISKSNLEVIE